MTIPYLDLKAVTAQHSEEIQHAVAQTVDSGRYLQGEAVDRFEQEFANYIGTRCCVGVANGLDALTLTLRAYMMMGKIAEGAEVIVPANTFIATVLAITDNGLKPVFVDIDEQTLTMNTQATQAAINERTGAVMMVHLYGRCNYDSQIGKLCKEKGIPLIEDNAQAHGCTCEGRKTGSLGDAGCHSFYPGKNLGALGDGGAVTTNDEELAQTIRHIANYGFERKYVATHLGRNSRLDEMQAAVLSVKLKYLDEDNARRQALAHTYYKNIHNENVRLPKMMANENNVYHIFPVFSPLRDKLQLHLEEKGIKTLIHYPIPPHLQQCYRQYKHLALPNTERTANEELSLPLNQTMTEEQAHHIIDTVNAFNANYIKQHIN